MDGRGLGSKTSALATAVLVDPCRDLGITSETLATAWKTTANVLDRYSALGDFDYEPRAELGESFLGKVRQLKIGKISPGEAETESLMRDVFSFLHSLPEVEQ